MKRAPADAELEPAIPSVNSAGDRAILGIGRKLGVVALGIVALGALWSFAMGKGQDALESKKDTASTAALPPLTIIAMEEPKAALQAPPAVPEAPPVIMVPPIPAALPLPSVPDPGAEAWETRKKAPVLAYGGGAAKRNPTLESGDGSIGDDAGSDFGDFALKLKPARFAAASASLLGNRDFLIAKGTMLDCALETAIDTTQVGFTACLLSNDIWSDNGKVLLLEKGSLITGQYRSGIKHGQNRVFVLWDRVKTPSGVVVALESPGTDPLGRSGLEGFIEHHFWERFGGAILLSLIDDASSAAATRLADGDFENTQTAAKDEVGNALSEAINIPPTLRKNQGDHIAIYVARDLEFSQVYRLEALP